MRSVEESSLLSTPHDRERREKRGVEKSDLQRARRYGMVEPGKWNGSRKYTHAGHIFIYDERRNKAISCWKVRVSGRKVGTAAVDPVLLRKSADHDSKEAVKLHNKLKNTLVTKKEEWKSHSVLVIDMSGSMRTDDVNGARCRSDGVWMVLARDFVKKQLDTGSASVYDMVSVVLMGETAHVPLRYEPLDWVLYNKLVELREWTTVKPTGHGFYVPALQKAEQVLKYNDCGSCSLSLFFFSDGKPSDAPHLCDEIYNTIGEMASRFGRRLVVSCVGMADGKEDFSVLEKMVQEADSYGCNSSFHKPSMSTDALSSIVTTLTSSMTSTKTELTELRTGRARTVRSDVLRERRDAPDDDRVPGSDWRLFGATSDTSYTSAVYAWNNHARDFAMVLDPRCVSCFRVVASLHYDTEKSNHTEGLCPYCKACFLCVTCKVQSQSNFRFHDCERLANERRNGLIVKRPLPSISVALKKSAFGEGAERLAFKFRFLDEKTNCFIGPKMVAKESRFVDTDEEDGKVQYLLSHQHSYHRNFMITQAIASRFASMYNKALDDLVLVFGSNRFAKKLKQYPRIRFVDPMIFELVEVDCPGSDPKKYNLLVEPMIEGTYQKWNNNFGKVANEVQLNAPAQAVSTSGISSESMAFLLGKTHPAVAAKQRGDTTLPLDMIEEEVSDEEDQWDSDIASMDGKNHGPSGYYESAESHEEKDEFDEILAAKADLAPPERSYSAIPDGAFAQAFSHFSYVRSAGKIIVVDLQGALQLNESDETREFVLTDPAIHKRRGAFRRRRTASRRLNFGRTDRGTAGIYAFFDTHVCNDACRLLGLRPKLPRGSVIDTAQPTLRVAKPENEQETAY